MNRQLPLPPQMMCLMRIPHTLQPLAIAQLGATCRIPSHPSRLPGCCQVFPDRAPSRRHQVPETRSTESVKHRPCLVHYTTASTSSASQREAPTPVRLWSRRRRLALAWQLCHDPLPSLQRIAPRKFMHVSGSLGVFSCCARRQGCIPWLYHCRCERRDNECAHVRRDTLP